ncbi:MAG: CHRD domain-containing protein [Leptolyngbyaceae cyanobacterium bins.59]|nr:CHRD domain-containing protein [Leptolyngbyaceae cyanobacterium bins.59]
MYKTTKTLLHVFLGVITFVFLVGLSMTPSLSSPNASRSIPETSARETAQVIAGQATSINQHLMADLREAESVLMAQGMPDLGMQRYAAILMPNNVVPSGPTTTATGVAGAVLMGDRLVVRGDFGSLSSPLRDYAADPVSPPNPNITSGVHIHRGDASQNGPFQYALTVMLNPSELGGRFSGAYTLTAEQKQALMNGQLYVDIHTKQNRAGELRGIFRAI